jgi:ribosomal protein S18 acetylase RimI-like enzyme
MASSVSPGSGTGPAPSAPGGTGPGLAQPLKCVDGVTNGPGLSGPDGGPSIRKAVAGFGVEGAATARERAPMQSTTIRPATEADLPAVLGFVRALARYEKLEHQVAATEEGLREALFGDRPGAEVLLAFEGEEAVGFAVFFHNFSTFLGRRGLYLEDLWVKPEARGRRHGKALLRHLARLAVERGCGRFEWTVLDWNEPSIRFYRSQGAEMLDEWRICRVDGEALRRLADGGGNP